MTARADPRHRLARLWLRNQRLAGSPPGAAPLRMAADVVARMGAVQAQEYPYARWSLGQRASGTLDEAAVEAALARGDIVRTHARRTGLVESATCCSGSVMTAVDAGRAQQVAL